MKPGLPAGLPPGFKGGTKTPITPGLPDPTTTIHVPHPGGPGYQPIPVTIGHRPDGSKYIVGVNRPDANADGGTSPLYVKPPQGPPAAAKSGMSAADWAAVSALVQKKTAGDGTTSTPGVAHVGLDPALVDALHSSFDDQEKSINDLHDKQLAHLDQLHQNGIAGVNQSGSALADQLHALGVDAQARGKGINKQIGGIYSETGKANDAELASLMHDLQGQGADTKGLLAEGGAAARDMHDQSALELGDSHRQQQLMGMILNDRAATGKTMTSGALNDMVAQLQNAQYNAEAQRTAQLGTARSQMDAGMVSAAEVAARANAAAQTKAATAKIPPFETWKAGTSANDVSSAFDQVLHHDKHPNQSNIADTYFQQISSAKDPVGAAHAALADWTARGAKDPRLLKDNPMVQIALTAAAIRASQNASNQNAANAYGSTFYG